MSRENVEIVRRSFEAWERGDLAGVLEMFDESVVTRPLIGPAWHGPEGVLEMAADWVEDFADHAMKAEEFLDAGETVVARVRQEGRGIGSGAPSGGLFWFAFTLRAGRVTRFDMYASEAEALEAVGARE